MTVNLKPQQDLDLSNCHRDPIHIPGNIQPFGALIATDQHLEKVTHISANLASILGGENTAWKNSSILGRELPSILPSQLVHDLCNVCGLPTIGSVRERLGTYEINGRLVDVNVHFNGDRTVIELEPLTPVNERLGHAVAHVNEMLERLPSDQDVRTLLEVIVGDLRIITGFDRVIAYQFLPDGAGEVMAEARCDEIESYLGLRFPAADVPEQVRDLALKISLRVIPDIHANPVQLLAFDRTEQPLDLSLTHVRGVVPLHLEYLANMGIEASMTLEILLNGELWGLFAFHHRQPKLLSPAFRSTIELFGRLFSLLLQQRLSAAHVHDLRRTAAEIANILVAQLDSENWQTLAMDIQSQLCQLFSAHGVAFVSSQGITTYGEVPPQPAIVTLVKTHHTDIKPNIIKIDNLQQTGPNTIQNWDISAGALIIELSLTELSHVVFFRNEIIREIRWAGNPEKKTIVDTSLGPRLCPRASFEEYKETVRGHCHPWSSYNLTAAHELQTQLIRYAVDRAQFFQQRRQDLLVAELNHRVKNVLALIRSVARQTQASTTSLPDYANLLESRIAALAMAHDLVAEHGLEWLTLHELITTELRPYSMASESRVTLLGQDVGLKANFIPTFVLVLHELISNAAKYGALSTSQGRLTVQWFERNEGLCIHWREAQGPLVQEPKHRGFGLTLIERAIPYEFEGETILRFNPSGVEADFWLPRHLIQWRPKQKEFRRNLTASSSLANALPETSADYTQGTALVVEDNIMLAMEMENILKYLGFEPIDCAPSTARALKLMEKNRYRICLLDINLKQETSFEIAQTLMAKQIPFIFTSGYQSYHVIPDQLQRYPLLKKPIDATTLDTTISKLLNS